jgi:hypothetical protein
MYIQMWHSKIMHRPRNAQKQCVCVQTARADVRCVWHGASLDDVILIRP